MKRLSSMLWLALLGVALLPATPVTAAEEEWEVHGGGWGHGVGMSQFGALGQAQAGREYDEILQHYYTDTSVKLMPSDHWTRQPNGLWVGLVSNTNTVKLEAVGGPVTICQPVGTCPPEPPYDPPDFGDVTIEPGQSWRFEIKPGDPTQCRFRQVDVGNLGEHDCNAVLTKADNTNVRFKVNGKEYARGQIRFTPAPNGFHVVVTLSMEEYLYGLAEVPNSWHEEALKAQAVAGRGFALATAQARGGSTGSLKHPPCGCHLLSTTADQAYAGWSKERPGSPNFGERWKKAVDDTNREVLTHPESKSFFNVARTFYSSSNGGHSENVEFVWGGSALPWLRSVEDPWSADPNINPLARWTMVLPSSKIESEFGWDSVTNVRVTTGPPGAVVEFTGRKGGSTVSTARKGEALRLFLIANAYNPSGGQVRVSPYVISVFYKGFFIDIAGSIFFNDITWLAQEGITKGCNPPSNNRFCPDQGVTRGQMAAFLARALELPASSTNHFTDDNGHTFEGDINRLADAGITRGCNPPANNRFCPDQIMTRGQMAAFLARALELPASSTNHFTDDNGHTFEGDINRLADADITRGCNPPANNRFCPNDKVTRAQMAAFIRRAFG